MTPATLQALRRLLFFSVDEAASMIGGVSPRSWQFWERGERHIPTDVIDRLESLCAWRANAIDASTKQIESECAEHGAPEGIALVWYQTLDDWLTLAGRDPLMWRPQCSVAAEISARFDAQIIAFDGPSYAKWLGTRKDSEAMRSAWAAES